MKFFFLDEKLIDLLPYNLWTFFVSLQLIHLIIINRQFYVSISRL